MLKSKRIEEEPLESINILPEGEGNLWRVRINMNELKHKKSKETKETNSAYVDSELDEIQSNQAVKLVDDVTEKSKGLSRLEKKIMRLNSAKGSHKK